MENVIGISHIADLDGVACGALICMKYNIPAKNIFYVDYSLGAILEVEHKLRETDLKNTSLFITDLGANDEKADVFVRIIQMVKKNGGKVFWFDHHPWGGSAAQKIAPLCDDIVYGERDQCASEITCEKLELKGAFVEHLIKICHASDFNLKPTNSDHMNTIKIYAIGIAYYNTKPNDVALSKLHALTKKLAKGELDNAQIARAAAVFERMNEKRIKVMLKDLHQIGANISVGFQHALQSTNACESIMKASGRDIGIFINIDKRRGNMRSKAANISPLAQVMGGGGHPHASGFEIDQTFDLSTKKGRDLLLEKLARESNKLGL